VQKKIKTIPIIDEVQKIYRHSYQHGEQDPMDIDMDNKNGNNKNGTADQFCETVKHSLQ
jgi:hypothetical protein